MVMEDGEKGNDENRTFALVPIKGFFLEKMSSWQEFALNILTLTPDKELLKNFNISL